MSPPLLLALNIGFRQGSGLVTLTKIWLLVCVKRPLMWSIETGKAAVMMVIKNSGSTLIVMTVVQLRAVRSQARTGCCCLDQQSK